MNRETEIQDRLRGKRDYLIPVFHDTFCISDRLKEYDPAFFIAFNSITQRFEIHSLENIGNTFCFAVGYKELDARVLRSVRKSNLRTRGKKIFQEIDEQNARAERSKERQRRNNIRAMAEEMHPHFREEAWNM